jgi:hypothetical protein
MEGIREYAVELVRSNYADFGPSLAAEMLWSKVIKIENVREPKGLS